MARLTDPSTAERPVPRQLGGVVRLPVAGPNEGQARGAIALGTDLGTGADEIYRAQKIEQEKADTTRVEDAWNQYKAAAMDATLGEKGVLRLQGGDAVNGDILEVTRRRMADSKQVISSALGNDEQRQRFTLRTQATDLLTAHQVLAHLDTQNREYAKTVLQGSEAAAQTQITAMPTSGVVFAQARTTLMGQADAYLRSQGITDPDAVAGVKAKINDGLWTKRIDALLYSQPLLAEAMFRANEKEFSNPELKLQMQAKTREVAMGMHSNIEAQKAFDEVRIGVTVAEGSPGAPNTNGLPTSRDAAAQLPEMLKRIEPAADRLYGADKASPDRAAFVKRMTAEIHSKVASEVQALNTLQRQAQGTVIDAVIGGRAGTPGEPITRFSQIQSDPKLMAAWQLMDPQAKLGIERLLEHNQRVTDPGDVVYYRSLWNRIHLEPGDPQKIDFYKQITDPAVANRLSIPQIRELRAEIDRAETPGGRSLTQMRRSADTNVAQWFKTHVMFTAQPERQIAATMRWNEEVGKKVDQYVKDGGNVRSLFTLDTPDSVVSAKYLQTFVDSTPAQALHTDAAKVLTPPMPPRSEMTPLDPANPDKTYEDLKPGTWFVAPNGRVGRKSGGTVPATAEQTPPAAAGAPPAAGPIKAPKIPELIQDRRGRATGGMTQEQLDRRAALGQEVIDTGAGLARAAGVPYTLAVQAASNAFRTPSEQAVAGFRHLVRGGTYTAASEPYIRDALDSGLLTGAEERVARSMLKKLQGAR